MDMAAVKPWFSAKSATEKHIIMLSLMWELTIVLRSMSTSVGNKELLMAALLASELTHKLSAYLISLAKGLSTYGNGDVLSLIDVVLTDERFFGQAINVWRNVKKTTDR